MAPFFWCINIVNDKKGEFSLAIEIDDVDDIVNVASIEETVSITEKVENPEIVDILVKRPTIIFFTADTTLLTADNTIATADRG